MDSVLQTIRTCIRWRVSLLRPVKHSFLWYWCALFRCVYCSSVCKLWIYIYSLGTLGSCSNGDGKGNKNVKRAISLIRKTTISRVTCSALVGSFPCRPFTSMTSDYLMRRIHIQSLLSLAVMYWLELKKVLEYSLWFIAWVTIVRMRGERIFVSSSAFYVKLVGQRETIYSDFLYFTGNCLWLFIICKYP